MREIRIYQAKIDNSGQFFDLTPEASQHVGTVLRMQPGAKIILFCGDNREFEAIITEVQRKKVKVAVQAERAISRESPRAIHLAQAIAKGERMEWLIQKAVELGVASIQPLITARCVIKLEKTRVDKKLAQWQAIAIAACEQSGRNQIPTLNAPISLPDYLKKTQSTLNFVLDPRGSKTWRDYCFDQAEFTVLIGPEGGFGPDELEQVLASNFKPLCLGPRILRAETAAIAAISMLQAVSGDL